MSLAHRIQTIDLLNKLLENQISRGDIDGASVTVKTLVMLYDGFQPSDVQQPVVQPVQQSVVQPNADLEAKVKDLSAKLQAAQNESMARSQMVKDLNIKLQNAQTEFTMRLQTIEKKHNELMHVIGNVVNDIGPFVSSEVQAQNFLNFLRMATGLTQIHTTPSAPAPNVVDSSQFPTLTTSPLRVQQAPVKPYATVAAFVPTMSSAEILRNARKTPPTTNKPKPANDEFVEVKTTNKPRQVNNRYFITSSNEKIDLHANSKDFMHATHGDLHDVCVLHTGSSLENFRGVTGTVNNMYCPCGEFNFYVRDENKNSKNEHKYFITIKCHECIDCDNVEVEQETVQITDTPRAEVKVSANRFDMLPVEGEESRSQSTHEIDPSKSWGEFADQVDQAE